MALVLNGSVMASPGQIHIPNTEIYATPEPPGGEKKVKKTKKPRIVTMNVSAYTEEEGNGDGLTASGVKGTPYLTCASDDLPFGTRIRINGRTWIVQDRFGGGYTNRLDLLMDTREHCFEWGRQYIEVEILED